MSTLFLKFKKFKKNLTIALIKFDTSVIVCQLYISVKPQSPRTARRQCSRDLTRIVSTTTWTRFN